MPVRPVVASRFLLQLDGVSCGFMQSVEGGAATADVIQEVGPEFFVKKHLGAARYEDMTVQAGFSMGKPLYEWITASLQMKAEPMNGAVQGVATTVARMPLTKWFFNKNELPT